LRGTRQLLRAQPPLNDLICFHSQQAADRYLKALLQEQGLPAPRTHDLEELLARLLPHDATLRGLRRGLMILTPYAVEYRYPGEVASRRQARAALRWAERIRREARRRLGLSSS
jgi:HEPN domain-containing protein